MRKPQELFIVPMPEEMTDPEDNSFGHALREHPGQGPLLWQSKIFKVVPASLLDEANRRIEFLKKALEFYADEDSWQLIDQHQKARILTADLETMEVMRGFSKVQRDIGGKTARAALNDEGEGE